jgi:hypothetical protein
VRKKDKSKSEVGDKVGKEHIILGEFTTGRNKNRNKYGIGSEAIGGVYDGKKNRSKY